MSRTLSGAFATMIASGSHTLCSMLQLVLRDGTQLGFTDHDSDLSFNIGDGVINYRAGTGILTSDVVLAVGLDADNFEVSGPISDDVTLIGILGGRANGAATRLFLVDHANLAAGPAVLLGGRVADVRPEGGKFVLEIRNAFDGFNQTVGRMIVNQCDADYGDGVRCHATAETLATTIATVTDAMHFTLASAGGRAGNYFDGGRIVFTSGGLAGDRAVEIFSWSAAGAVETWQPLADVPAVGAAVLLTRGCSKTRAVCVERGQILNFRGYPEVPGTDQVLRLPVPGQ